MISIYTNVYFVFAHLVFKFVNKYKDHLALGGMGSGRAERLLSWKTQLAHVENQLPICFAH